MRPDWVVVAGIAALAAVSSLVWVAVAGPVLHERFSADPAEDLRLGATTTRGAMPAALETESGLVSAPDASRQFEPGATYGGSKTVGSSDGQFHLDRITTRPSHVEYDEPFRPSILPFKRLYAFDQLAEDGSFTVADSTLRELAVGGVVEASEDAFFADLEVELVRGVPVRIPSVGPGARIIALEVDPEMSVEVLRDSAENWFAQARETRSVRVLMQLAVRRQTMGSHFLPVGWSRLRPFVVSLPKAFDERARSLWSTVGVSRELSPAGAVQTLVHYFRGFAESVELARASDPLELFEELTRAQKGVCRHRAYAFAVIAISLGLPTRLVHNEAHAWVEVFDSELWHRIDLGGAATDLQLTRNDPSLPQHRPPPDPYSWPFDSQPTARSMPAPSPHSWRTPDSPPRGAPQKPGSFSAEDQSASTGATRAAEPVAGSGRNRDGGRRDGEFLDEVRISLRVESARIERGHPVTVSGRVTEANRPCQRARVDVLLVADEELLPIGSVATDRRGDFSGQVTVPRDAPVGTLPLLARLHAGCSR